MCATWRALRRQNRADIGSPSASVHADRSSPCREPPRLWRHATCWPRGVQAAPGRHDAALAVLQGCRRWRKPYRHQQFLRPTHHQPSHPKGSAPYPADLTLVTKVGARRGEKDAWLPTILIDSLAEDRFAYVPFFSLGGFDRLQSSALSAAAHRLDATPTQLALASRLPAGIRRAASTAAG